MNLGGVQIDINYNYVFWAGTIVFFLSSIVLWVGRLGDVGYVFYLQVLAGFLIFAGSKIGRAFLGLE
jgi:hypothetical protein